jgi:tetratricopeptide (TPR) repeat protein
MILAFLIVAASAESTAAIAPVPPEIMVQEAAKAAASGRLDQARLMAGRLISQGVQGAEVERVLADVAFAAGNYAEALHRYEALLAAGQSDAVLLERAGVAAFKLTDFDRAAPLIRRATSAKEASWRAWNARGALADVNRDWRDADESYEEALRLAPDEAAIFNNRGWSQLLRGDWSTAIEDFERAAMLDPKLRRAANNLELARTALAADLPTRRRDESDGDWAHRLNDAGVAAEILGDKSRAVAAFTQALEASDRWYARAASNLEAVSRQ